MLKIVSENFIHALLVFLGLFLKISRWVPLCSFVTEKAPLLGLKQIFLIFSVELSQATQALREPFEFAFSKNMFWNILPFETIRKQK